jgi:tRNA threonylcarbamoyladenosine modification (KEOPS) complex  Pcc1 subunit
MGLGQLADELRRCAETETGSEHGIRLGPYEDLVLYRWDRPGIDDHGIYGPPVALTSLADMMEENLGAPGSSAVIGPEYASDVEYRLRLEVREDDFDPTTVMPVPGDADVAELTNRDEAAELAHAAEFVVSPSVPCYYYDSDANFTETHGIVHLEGFDIVMQFETKDVFFQVYKSGAKEVRLSLEEISTVRFKRGFFGRAELRIQARDIMSVKDVPTAKAALIRLKFKRANRELGEALADMLEERREALARMMEEPRE